MEPHAKRAKIGDDTSDTLGPLLFVQLEKKDPLALKDMYFQDGVWLLDALYQSLAAKSA